MAKIEIDEIKMDIGGKIQDGYYLVSADGNKTITQDRERVLAIVGEALELNQPALPEARLNEEFVFNEAKKFSIKNIRTYWVGKTEYCRVGNCIRIKREGYMSSVYAGWNDLKRLESIKGNEKLFSHAIAKLSPPKKAILRNFIFNMNTESLNNLQGEERYESGCPLCGGRNTVKNGHSTKGVQRILCLDCGRTMDAQEDPKPTDPCNETTRIKLGSTVVELSKLPENLQAAIKDKLLGDGNNGSGTAHTTEVQPEATAEVSTKTATEIKTKETRTVNCPQCWSDEVEHIEDKRNARHTVKKYSCKSCGLFNIVCYDKPKTENPHTINFKRAEKLRNGYEFKESPPFTIKIDVQVQKLGSINYYEDESGQVSIWDNGEGEMIFTTKTDIARLNEIRELSVKSYRAATKCLEETSVKEQLLNRYFMHHGKLIIKEILEFESAFLKPIARGCIVCYRTGDKVKLYKTNWSVGTKIRIDWNDLITLKKEVDTNPNWLKRVMGICMYKREYLRSIMEDPDINGIIEDASNARITPLPDPPGGKVREEVSRKKRIITIVACPICETTNSRPMGTDDDMVRRYWCFTCHRSFRGDVGGKPDEPIKCPGATCGSTDVIKWGKQGGRHGAKKKYLCRKCKIPFSGERINGTKEVPVQNEEPVLEPETAHPQRFHQPVDDSEQRILGLVKESIEITGKVNPSKIAEKLNIDPGLVERYLKTHSEDITTLLEQHEDSKYLPKLKINTGTGYDGSKIEL